MKDSESKKRRNSNYIKGMKDDNPIERKSEKSLSERESEDSHEWQPPNLEKEENKEERKEKVNNEKKRKLEKKGSMDEIWDHSRWKIEDMAKEEREKLLTEFSEKYPNESEMLQNVFKEGDK